MTTPRLTLNDVARAAGVSRGTVSNVFAHPERVRPDVRQHVEATAREIGYAGPDPRGRLLRAGKTHALGLVIPGAYGIVNMVESPYGRQLLFGVGEACDAAGLSLVLLDGRPDQMELALRNALVDGVIFGHSGALTMMEAARRRHLPFVVLDAATNPADGVVAIAAGDGARQAARHLIGLGHRRFAIISTRRTPGPPIVHPPGPGRTLADGFRLDRLKLDGYATALAEAGIGIDDVPIVETVPWEPAAFDAIRAAAPGATGLLVMSDRQALLLLAEAVRRGVHVPEQLSIVGYDGVPESALSVPPLTTIVQPIRDKGRLAAQMLIEGGEPRQLTLDVRLEIRGSSGPAPKGR